MPAIAVLPFTNLSGDPAHEHFGDGITEDIVTALSKISGLLVVAHHSTLGYKGKSVSVEQIGREQRVQYVLEGSVRSSGNRVRVTAQLGDACTGRQLWADRYDRELDDIFAVQDEITRSLVVALQVKLTEGEQARVHASGTNDVEAWECAVRGKSLVERHVREDNLEAQRLLQRAVQIDPGYATAWAYLGWSHWENARWGWSESESDQECMDLAFEAAQRALTVDDADPDGCALLAMLHMSRGGELAQALNCAEKAVAAAPSHAFALGISACVLRALGRIQDALRRISRAMRVSPIHPTWFRMVQGSLYHLTGDQTRGVSILREAARGEPDSTLSKAWLVSALVQAGLEDEARSEAKDILRIEPGFSRTRWTRSIGFGDPAATARLSSNLAKAGLPE